MKLGVFFMIRYFMVNRLFLQMLFFSGIADMSISQFKPFLLQKNYNFFKVVVYEFRNYKSYGVALVLIDLTI